MNVPARRTHPIARIRDDERFPAHPANSGAGGSGAPARPARSVDEIVSDGLYAWLGPHRPSAAAVYRIVRDEVACESERTGQALAAPSRSAFYRTLAQFQHWDRDRNALGAVSRTQRPHAPGELGVNPFSGPLSRRAPEAAGKTLRQTCPPGQVAPASTDAHSARRFTSRPAPPSRPFERLYLSANACAGTARQCLLVAMDEYSRTIVAAASAKTPVRSEDVVGLFSPSVPGGPRRAGSVLPACPVPETVIVDHSYEMTSRSVIEGLNGLGIAVHAIPCWRPGRPVADSLRSFGDYVSGWFGRNGGTRVTAPGLRRAVAKWNAESLRRQRGQS